MIRNNIKFIITIEILFLVYLLILFFQTFFLLNNHLIFIASFFLLILIIILRILFLNFKQKKLIFSIQKNKKFNYLNILLFVLFYIILIIFENKNHGFFSIFLALILGFIIVAIFIGLNNDGKNKFKNKFSILINAKLSKEKSFFNNIYKEFMEEIQQTKVKEKENLSYTREREYLLYHKARYFFMYKMLNTVDINKRKYIKILDIGPSYLTIILKKMHYNVFAVGIDKKWQKKLHKEKIEYKKYDCNTMDTKIPYPLEKFDIIIFNEVIEHLTIHPKHYLLEFRRVLKQNGVLIISIPNFATLPNRIMLLLGINPQPMFLFDDRCGEAHIRVYTMNEIISLLKQSGFKVIKKYRPLYFDLPSIRRTKLIQFLRIIIYPFVIIFPFLRAAICVIAKKR